MKQGMTKIILHLDGIFATQISVEDVMRAIHLKSFDYRVLNLLLYQLRGERVNSC